MPHNQAQPVFVEDMVRALAHQVAERIGADALGGENLLTEGDVADDPRRDPRGRVGAWPTLAELWPILTAEQVLADLYADADRLESPRRSCPMMSAALLHREPTVPRGPPPTCRCSTRPRSCSARTTRH